MRPALKFPGAADLPAALAAAGPMSPGVPAAQTERPRSDPAGRQRERGWIGRRNVGADAEVSQTVPATAAVATVDLGGTSLRVAVGDPAGRLHGKEKEPTDRQGGMAVVRQVARLCRGAAFRAGIADGRIKAAVAGVPGVPDPETGRIRMAPNIDGLDEFDVRAALADALGVDVLLENDVNVALLGEAWQGGHRGKRDMLHVKLGTGVGAALLCNGALVRGHRGAAGQIGSVPIGADPEDPESLRAGALERATGGRGIREGYRRRTGRAASVAEIFRRANDGEAEAAETLDKTADLLARGFGAVAALLAPECILLGGSIGEREEFRARVQARLGRIHPAPPPVLPETPGLESALLGCLFLGLQHVAGAEEGLPGRP